MAPDPAGLDRPDQAEKRLTSLREEVAGAGVLPTAKILGRGVRLLFRWWA
ncbi:hypothetical protein [Micromonospora zingiberis]|nr:hypothetical protein [Micromonospora zingiberis]